MKKILFVCSSKQIGGAEKQLLLLAQKIGETNSVSIFLFGKPGAMESVFLNSKLEVEVHSDSLAKNLFRLAKKIRAYNPEVQINWLYQADILGGILGRLFSVPMVINSARNTYWPGLTRPRMAILKYISKFAPNYIVANSQRALEWHCSQGYPRDKMVIIPNLLSDPSKDPGSIPNLKSIKLLRLGIAARPVTGKGHELLLDAILKLPIEVQERIECSFIGFGLPKSDLADRLRKRCPERLELLDGELDLTDWFKSIHVYCAVSEAWESDSNSTNEAIMNHRAVIASDILDVYSYVPPLSSFENGNSLSLAVKLLKLINHGYEINAGAVVERRLNLIAVRNPDLILSYWESLFSRKN